MNKREEWLDFVRGIAALMVVLVHIPNNVLEYEAFCGFIMLPTFFWVSGYLVKPNGNLIEYVYNRIGKLIVLYFVYALIVPYLSVGRIVNAVKKPTIILENFKDSIIGAATGQKLWFIACLITINLIFVIIFKASRDNSLVLSCISILLCVMGLLISKEGAFRIWSYDVALVSQIFFTIGFLSKKHAFFDNFTHNRSGSIIAIVLYLTLFLISFIFLGYEEMYINIHESRWGEWYITIPLILFGLLSIIFIAKVTNGNKFVNYIGTHSLPCYVLGYAFSSKVDEMFFKIYEITNIDILGERHFLILAITIIAGIVMIIPFMLIDKFIPFLNGRFKMPAFRRNQ